MKHLMKALALGGALAALAPLAHAASIAGTIGFGGNGTYSATTNLFTAGANVDGTGHDAYVNKAGTGTLGMFTVFNPADFFSFNSVVIGSGEPVFATSETVGANLITLTFKLTGFTKDASNAGVGDGFAGTGILTETGYDPTAATFSLNTNSGAGTFVTFNTAAVAATPEPSSLILLGTGVLGAAGMLRRRFTGKSNA